MVNGEHSLPPQVTSIRYCPELGAASFVELEFAGNYSFVSAAAPVFDFHLKHAVDAVIGIITRHPMREDELRKALSHWSSADVDSTLQELEQSGRAQVIERYGCRFWSAGSAHYPNQTHSKSGTQ